MEALKALMKDFDPAALMPDLDTVLGKLEGIIRLAVMVAPLVLLGLGLLYLLAPPKEANYSLGYRFWWSMASLDAWQFTHRLVGCVWTPLGLLLAVIMALICNGFRRMDPMDMVWTAAKCLGWELGLTLVACLAIDIVVVVVFDRYGYRRSEYED